MDYIQVHVLIFYDMGHIIRPLFESPTSTSAHSIDTGPTVALFLFGRLSLTYQYFNPAYRSPLSWLELSSAVLSESTK